MTTKEALQLLTALGNDIEPHHHGKLDNHGRTHFEMAVEIIAKYNLDFQSLGIWDADPPSDLAFKYDLVSGWATKGAMFGDFLMEWGAALFRRTAELNLLMAERAEREEKEKK